jgi:hypothetical protein
MNFETAFDLYVTFMAQASMNPAYPNEIEEIVNMWPGIHERLSTDQQNGCRKALDTMKAVANIQHRVSTNLDKVFTVLNKRNCVEQENILRDVCSHSGIKWTVVMENITHSCEITGDILENIVQLDVFNDDNIVTTHWVAPGVELDILKIFYLYANFDRRIANGYNDTTAEHLKQEFNYAEMSILATANMICKT